MSKYVIEKKEDEVIFRQLNLKEEGFENELVELTEEELDQQLTEYSKQGFYVSCYHQEVTEDGIDFVETRMTNTDLWDGHKLRPKESKKSYVITRTLFNVEIFEASNDVIIETEFGALGLVIYDLTDKELADKIKEFLEQGYEVCMGDYEYKRRKRRFIPCSIVKEVTEDGKILYK